MVMPHGFLRVYSPQKSLPPPKEIFGGGPPPPPPQKNFAAEVCQISLIRRNQNQSYHSAVTECF